MKDIKKNVIYAALVIALFLSPLVVPSNGKQYNTAACCVFVVLCFLFKVQSAIRTLIPLIIFSVLIPIAILIAIARPISTSWLGAANYFFAQFNSRLLLDFIFPVVLSILLHFGLARLSAFRKNKTV